MNVKSIFKIQEFDAIDQKCFNAIREYFIKAEQVVLKKLASAIKYCMLLLMFSCKLISLFHIYCVHNINLIT